MGIRKNLLLNNRFLLAIGRDLYSFARVSNLTDSYELETIQQGGSNQSAEFLPGLKSRTETLVLEQGVASKAYNWSGKSLKPGARLFAVSIMILGRGSAKKVEKEYCFDYGIVTKWEVSPLNALGNEVLIHKIEITHSGLYEGRS